MEMEARDKERRAIGRQKAGLRYADRRSEQGTRTMGQNVDRQVDRQKANRRRTTLITPPWKEKSGPLGGKRPKERVKAKGQNKGRRQKARIAAGKRAGKRLTGHRGH